MAVVQWNQAPIRRFSSAMSSGEADQGYGDHGVGGGNPGYGGGPLVLNEETYIGFGFRVDRVGFPPKFEICASACCAGLFISSGVCSAEKSASEGSEVAPGVTFFGRPLAGLEASLASGL